MTSSVMSLMTSSLTSLMISSTKLNKYRTKGIQKKQKQGKKVFWQTVAVGTLKQNCCKLWDHNFSEQTLLCQKNLRYNTLHYSTILERYNTLHVLYCTNPSNRE